MTALRSRLRRAARRVAPDRLVAGVGRYRSGRSRPGPFDELHRLGQLDRLDQLQHLDRLGELDRLGQLDRLVHLDRLGELQRLAGIEQRLQTIDERVGRHDTRLDALRALLHDPEVEPYQPTYGLTGLLPSAPRRACVDRCRTIEHYLGGVSDLRVLDIGSSLGFVSFYLADRGAVVTGWESHVKNAEAARQIGSVNGLDVTFRTTSFDGDTVGTIETGRFDVALLLSVVHHLVHAEGLAYVQGLLAELLQRVPLVILELARKGEDPDLYWDAAQPADELAVLEHVRDEVEIVKLGEFGNHLSDRPRPLYAVRNRVSAITVNGRPYRYERCSVAAYQGSPMPANGAHRRYYFDDAHIVKQYHFDTDHEAVNRSQIVAEINALVQLADLPGVPELLDYEITPSRATLVVKRIPGALLADLLPTGTLDLADARLVAGQVLATLSQLEATGHRHNDVRSWNVIYDGRTASLIDYGLVSPLAADDDARSLLWLVKAVLTGEREDFDPRLDDLPDRDLLAGEAGLEKLYLAVEAGERSPRRLLHLLESAPAP